MLLYSYGLKWLNLFLHMHIQREELTEVILRLLGAWGDPLSQLHRSMTQDQNQDFNHYSSNKALEMSDMVHELRSGVAKVAEKVRLWMLILCIFCVVICHFNFRLINLTGYIHVLNVRPFTIHHIE